MRPHRNIPSCSPLWSLSHHIQLCEQIIFNLIPTQGGGMDNSSSLVCLHPELSKLQRVSATHKTAKDILLRMEKLIPFGSWPNSACDEESFSSWDTAAVWSLARSAALVPKSIPIHWVKWDNSKRLELSFLITSAVGADILIRLFCLFLKRDPLRLFLISKNLLPLTSVGPSASLKVRQPLLLGFDQIQSRLWHDTVAYQSVYRQLKQCYF